MTRQLSTDDALLKGLRFALGDGVRKNNSRARAYLIQAAEAGDPEAMCFAARMLEDGEGGPFDRATAFRYVEQAANLGHPEAIYRLGYYYLYGGMGNVGYSDEVLAQMEVPQDEPRGLSLLRSAARRGHARAAYRIGEHYEGLADEKRGRLSRAIRWYERSLRLGEPNALVRLADFHILGRGVPKNRRKARSMYRRAAQSEDYCAKNAGEQRLRDFNELESILREFY